MLTPPFPQKLFTFVKQFILEFEEIPRIRGKLETLIKNYVLYQKKKSQIFTAFRKKYNSAKTWVSCLKTKSCQHFWILLKHVWLTRFPRPWRRRAHSAPMWQGWPDMSLQVLQVRKIHFIFLPPVQGIIFPVTQRAFSVT